MNLEYCSLNTENCTQKGILNNRKNEHIILNIATTKKFNLITENTILKTVKTKMIVGHTIVPKGTQNNVKNITKTGKCKYGDKCACNHDALTKEKNSLWKKHRVNNITEL